MADDYSHLWHLTDTQNLTHYYSHYPQKVRLQLCTIQPAMNSALLSALQWKLQPPELYMLQLQITKHGGFYGWQNTLSRKSILSKIPAQPTPLIML